MKAWARQVGGIAAGLAALLLASSGAAGAADPEAQGLSEAAQRGRMIYIQGGHAATGPRVARVGEHDIELPARSVPCASCHGADGQGRPESGVYPTRLDWAHLARRDGHRHSATGRVHPPFEAESFRAAVAAGLDPAGNRLDPVMPRYDYAPEEIDDLIAYLREIRSHRDPGIDDGVLRLGTVIPSTGPLAELGRSVEAVLRARIEQVNAGNGIHGRRLEWVIADGAAGGAQSVSAADQLAESEEIFALVAVVAPAQEQALADIARHRGIPVIAPVSITSPPARALHGPVYFIYPDLTAQAIALLRHAGRRISGEHALFLLANDHALLGQLAATAREAAWDAVIPRGCPADEADAGAFATALQARPGSVVLFACTDSRLSTVVERDTARAPATLWLAPGALAEPGLFALPAEQRARIRVALPSIPADLRGPRGDAFLALVGALDTDPRYIQAQMNAFAALELLFEGLRLGGRNLTQAGFTAALDSLAGFETGVSPPLSYRGGHHIGAAGAYIAEPQGDPGRFVQVDGWVQAH